MDVHHHVLPPSYVAARERHGIRTGPGFEGALSWTPATSIEQMDATGIATSILSHTSNWTPFAPDEAAHLARDSNEFTARLVSDHPGRFGFFAAIPMPDVEASLRELEYALDTLGADGVCTTTNYGDVWPGDARFDPVFEELNRRGAVVFVHPQAPRAAMGLTPPVPDGTVEFMFDIVRCVTAMLFRGTFTRFPDIRFIFTHGGGGLATLAERIGRNAANQPAVAARLPNGAAAELRRLFIDVTTSTNAPAFAALREFMPASQLLFGSDYPFVPPAATAAGFDRAGLPEADLAAISRENAWGLFPRLGAT